jgi:hypothetical protein
MLQDSVLKIWTCLLLIAHLCVCVCVCVCVHVTAGACTNTQKQLADNIDCHSSGTVNLVFRDRDLSVV